MGQALAGTWGLVLMTRKGSQCRAAQCGLDPAGIRATAALTHMWIPGFNLISGRQTREVSCLISCPGDPGASLVFENPS